MMPSLNERDHPLTCASDEASGNDESSESSQLSFTLVVGAGAVNHIKESEVVKYPEYPLRDYPLGDAY